MPFNRPTLPELQERTGGDIRSRLQGANPDLRRSLLGIIRDMHAGSAHGMYGYLDWLSHQILPDTAEGEYLRRHAGIWDVPLTEEAAATGQVEITGTDGAVLPQGALLTFQDGTEYTTDSQATIASGIALVDVTASAPGTEGNRDQGDELTLAVPETGINSTATVDADGITGGADPETDSRLRDRLLSRIRRPPHGGSADDYEAWALAAHPDVTRVFIAPLEMGLGTVTIRPMTDDLVDPIPTQGVIDAVEEYIQKERPVGSEPFVVAPIAAPLDMTILITPDTQEVRDRIESALKDFLLLNASPGATIKLNQLNGAIYVAAGSSSFDIQIPSDDITHSTGEIAIPGTITWA